MIGYIPLSDDMFIQYATTGETFDPVVRLRGRGKDYNNWFSRITYRQFSRSFVAYYDAIQQHGSGSDKVKEVRRQNRFNKEFLTMADAIDSLKAKLEKNLFDEIGLLLPRFV